MIKGRFIYQCIGFILLFGATICPFQLFSQEQFDLKKLDKPKKYGTEVAQLFEVNEISEYIIDTTALSVHIKNGLRSSTYINPEDWLSINDQVHVEKISIIFSKYPIREDGYHMNHPLLFNRLKKLFDIDPMLNDSTIQWEIILQTNCKNDEQVDSLYHGVAISFSKPFAIVQTSEIQQDISDETLKQLADSMSISLDSTMALVQEFQQLRDLPEHIKKDLTGRNNREKLSIIIEFLEEEYQSIEEVDDSQIDQEFLDKHEALVRKFVEYYNKSNDLVVQTVFDRNPQWKNALVVADWTGSMYQYGSQALHWHILNFETSGLTYFTLFNDGDRKFNFKKIGETGGIYHEKANNIEKMLDLYQLVMMKGGGGDIPENDMEAIIKGMEHFPDHDDVILIADNNSCVRDIELLELINKPVHVIVCGYSALRGVNPQYIQIAEKTGGSIHTIEKDIEVVKTVKDKRGVIKKVVDEELKVGLSFCANFVGEEAYTDFLQRRKERRHIKYLKLEEQDLTKIPRKIRQYTSLNKLDMSHNGLTKIGGKLKKNKRLKIIDLSYNEFTFFPKELAYNRYLREVYINNNEIDSIWSLRDFRYLTHLNLNDNNLRYLPDLSRNRDMEVLYINNNKLVSIPNSIKSMRELIQLDLSNNQLTELPKRIAGLKSLEVLDLSNNNFTEAPYQLAKLRSLQSVNLSGNPISLEEIEKLRKLMPKVEIVF